MRSKRDLDLFTYRQLTDRTYSAMKRLMDESHKRPGAQALQRREWAYGMYLGWRAIVFDRINPTTFSRDDQMLEALLNE